MVMHYMRIAVLRLIYNNGGVYLCMVMVVVIYALYYNCRREVHWVTEHILNSSLAHC